MLNKNLLFVCILFFIGIYPIFAQDQIFLKNGGMFYATIISETPSGIRYTYPDRYGDMEFILHMSGVQSIRYVNERDFTDNQVSSSGETTRKATRKTTRGTYTVRFEPNGAMGTEPATQRVQRNSSITLPNGSGLSFGNARFGGWILYVGNVETILNPGSTFKPNDSATLYAKWEIDANDINSVTGLANKLVWIKNNVESNGNYIVEINANETIGTQFLNYPGKQNVTITFRGIGANRTVNFTARQYYCALYIASDVTLVLDNNITLQTSHDLPFINVGGTLIMNNGSTIISNGAVGVEVGGGVFTMNGGTITGCRTAVVIGILGIGDKRAGTFTMNGGTITQNNGSGVVVASGTFNMTNGTISNNIRTGDGAGVNVGSPLASLGPAVFNMSGGIITGNESRSEILKDGSRVYARGGGVAVYRSGKFTMTGGTITGNKGDKGTNGVFTERNTFTNRGGTVQPD